MRIERTHGLSPGAGKTWCGRETGRFPFPVIAGAGEDPDCGSCSRIADPKAAPSPRCGGCGYILPKCDCDQRALVQRVRKIPRAPGTSVRRAAEALAILGDGCPAGMRKVAEARIAEPAATWGHIGRQTGLSSGAAKSLLYSMLLKAGT
jgi:hypothetical protein